MNSPAGFDQVLKELGFPLVPGGYGTILADPPWSFDDKGSRAAPDWKEHKLYETMKAEEILELPVDLLAAPDAHLYLWTTDIHLSLALDCMDAWGFRMTRVLVWVKRRSATAPILCQCGEPEVIRGPLHTGYGHYYRGAKELVLFGVRGRCPALVHNLPDVFEGPRTQHSRKPDTLHEWAEKLSPGPRIELFARRSREGWEGWGDQFPGHDAYLRYIDQLNTHRREARAVTTAQQVRKREKAQAGLSEMVQGITRWGARCHICRGPIGAGETCLYHPQTNAKVCLLCANEHETLARAGAEAVPF